MQSADVKERKHDVETMDRGLDEEESNHDVDTTSADVRESVNKSEEHSAEPNVKKPDTGDAFYKISDKRSCNFRGCVIIAAGCLIHLTLGTLYSYGNFSPYIISYIRRRSSPSDLRFVDGTWVQACMMIGQGVTMATGGLIERKLGPRLTTLIGCWTMSSGVLLTYFTVQHSYVSTVITFGLMFGMGIGIAYPIPLGCAMKWLPDRSGLVSGAIIAGFGAGALVFNQVITAYINPDNYSPDDDIDGERYFAQPEVLDRVPYCFLVLGGTYAVTQLLACSLLVDPPMAESESVRAVKYIPGEVTGNLNEGFTEDTTMKNTKTTDIQIENNVNINTKQDTSIPPKHVLTSKNFYILWLIFLFGGEGVVFISSQYKSYGQSFISDDRFLSIAGSVSAIFNAGGSIFWGFIMDRFSFKTAARSIYVLFACLTASFLACEHTDKAMYFVWVCLFFFVFAGIFTIMPPAIARMYGIGYVGVNFGLLFTSQIITGATSAFLGQILKDSIGWHGLFFLSTGFTVAGLIMTCFLTTKTPDGDDF